MPISMPYEHLLEKHEDDIELWRPNDIELEDLNVAPEDADAKVVKDMTCLSRDDLENVYYDIQWSRSKCGRMATGERGLHPCLLRYMTLPKPW